MTTPQNQTQKLVITLTHNTNDDKSTVAFTIANAALSKGMQVGVFLASDGVETSRDGACDFTNIRPFKALNELIDGFLANGGVVWACSPCFQHRGMKENETVDGVIVTGAGPLLEWIADGAKALSF